MPCLFAPATRRRSMLAVVAGVGAALSVASAAEAAVTVKLRNHTKTVQVPAGDALSTTMAYSQYTSAACGSKERAIGVGIKDAPTNLVDQSFGPMSISSAAARTTTSGPIKLRLQALCVRGVKVTHDRTAGKVVGGSATSGYTAYARGRCKGGALALGTPLSQPFSPGGRGYSALGVDTSSWEVRINGISGNFPVTSATPAWADVACVSKRNVKNVTRLTETLSGLQSQPAVSKTVTCPGKTRPLGWGISQQPFRSYPTASVAGGWVLPFVRRAELSSRAIDFTVELPAGVTASLEATQTVQVTCGTLKEPAATKLLER